MVPTGVIVNFINNRLQHIFFDYRSRKLWEESSQEVYHLMDLRFKLLSSEILSVDQIMEYSLSYYDKDSEFIKGLQKEISNIEINSYIEI